MINVEKQKCIVELGNTKINCVIAEPDKDYRIKILRNENVTHKKGTKTLYLAIYNASNLRTYITVKLK